MAYVKINITDSQKNHPVWIWGDEFILIEPNQHCPENDSVSAAFSGLVDHEVKTEDNIW